MAFPTEPNRRQIVIRRIDCSADTDQRLVTLPDGHMKIISTASSQPRAEAPDTEADASSTSSPSCSSHANVGTFNNFQSLILPKSANGLYEWNFLSSFPLSRLHLLIVELLSK